MYDEAAKSKPYDVDSDTTLDRAIEILYQKETANYKLQESKSAHIYVVKGKAKKKTSQGSQSKPAAEQYKSGKQDNKIECGYCGGNHPKGKKNAANHKCERCNRKGHFAKKCRTSPARVAQIAEPERKDDSEDEGSQVFIGSVTSQIHETSSGIASPKKMTSLSLGWYIKLKRNSDLLPWYIDSGAEISVMPETLYKKSYGDIHSMGRIQFATGENPLHTLGCVRMELARRQNAVARTTCVRKVLIPNIPGA